MIMKQTTALATAFLLGGGMLLAQTTSTGTPSQGDRSKGDRMQKLSAEVVSTDTAARTITVRNVSPASDKDRSTSAGGATSGTMGEQTLRLEGKAADRLGSLKAGDKVTLTCKTNASLTGTGGTTNPGTTGSTTSPSRPNPDTPTPQPPSGTNTRTDPTIPPSENEPSSSGGRTSASEPSSSAGRTSASDMSRGAMGSLQPCQTVTDISKSGS
jgi:hypothetical protein